MIIKKIEGKKRNGFLVQCECDNCGKEFISKYSEQTRRNKKYHFCCKNCYRKWSSKRINPNPNWRENLKKNWGLTGNKNPNWKGGKTFNSKGYIYIYSPTHPYNIKNYVLKHRLVMEKAIGRYLSPEEVVHHINRDKTNNKLENLMLFKNASEHSKHHNILKNGGELIRQSQRVFA